MIKKTLVAFALITYCLLALPAGRLPIVYPTVVFAQSIEDVTPTTSDTSQQTEDQTQGSQIQNEADFLSNPQSLQAVLPDSLQQKTNLDSFLSKVKDIPIIGGLFSGIFTKIFPRTQLWQAVTVPGNSFQSFTETEKPTTSDLLDTSVQQQGFLNFVRPGSVNFEGDGLDEFKSGTRFLENSLLPGQYQTQ